MSRTNPLHRMLTPDSIAFVGANNNVATMGTIQMLNTLKFGFEGRIYPVHPSEKEVLGLKAYASVRHIPESVDLAVITVPARVVPQVIQDCAASGVRHAVVTSGGFGEFGDQGKRLEAEITDLAKEHRIRFIGPNCIGVLNPHHGLNLTMFRYIQPPGPMGLASQSGSYVTQVIHYLARRGMGFSRALSIGNKADIDMVDCLEYLGEDPETRAVALYIEGLKRPRLFLETARRVTREKPVVALYVGGTEAGARASASHTGAVCAPGKLYSDMFRQAGIIEAGTVEDLFFWAWTLANQPPPRGSRVAILTHSGGPASSIADACNKNGLEVPQLSPRTKAVIRPLVPPTAVIENPVDLTFAPDSTILARDLPKILLEDPDVDALIIHGLMATSWLSYLKDSAEELVGDISLDELGEMFENPVRELSEFPRKYGKPVICSTFMGAQIEAATQKLHKYLIPTSDGPEKAAAALAALVRYREIKERR